MIEIVNDKGEVLIFDEKKNQWVPSSEYNFSVEYPKITDPNLKSGSNVLGYSEVPGGVGLSETDFDLPVDPGVPGPGDVPPAPGEVPPAPGPENWRWIQSKENIVGSGNGGSGGSGQNNNLILLLVAAIVIYLVVK